MATTGTAARDSVLRLRSLASLVAAYGIWPLAAMVAASIATERAQPIALAVAAALVAARWLATGAFSVRTPADWPIAALALMGLLSLAVTARSDLTGPQVGRLLLGMAFYYELINWAVSRQRLELVALGLVGAGTVLALGAPLGVDWALAQLKFSFIPAGVYERFVLLGEDTINPNVMAGYLALLLPCVLAPALFSWSQIQLWRRGLHAGAATLMAGVLLLTQSRAGVVAVAVGLLVIMLLRWRRAWPLAAGAAALALGAGAWLLARLGVSVSTGGLAERVEVWSRGWYMVQDFAFTGIGMGSFPYVTERFYPLVLQETLPHSHNLLLQVAVDLGLPGLFAWLATLSLVSLAAWRAYSASDGAGDDWLAGFAAGLLGAQAAMLAHGMFDAVTWGMVRPSLLIWGLWGAAVAAQRVALARQGPAGSPASAAG